jgi:riboflavin kinase/FMN adenylyltransferase
MSSAAALTIGHFDGVHRGHAALVRACSDALRGRANGASGRVVVLAFDPHPATVLRPGAEPPRLSHWAEREALLAAAGADVVVRLVPTREFLGLSADAFLEGLVREHAPAAIVEGADFRFGRGREGSLQTMRDFASRAGARRFDVIEVPQVEAVLADHSVVRVSSTMVRWLLARGRVREAAELLGRAYEISGTVVRGDGRGRELGIPTANLDQGELLLPADGIYAGTARLPDGRHVPAAISVGTKPTFGERPRTCEAFLLEYDGPVGEYGWPLALTFEAWLRDQVRYDSVESMTEQIRRDIDRVRQRSGCGLACAAEVT